MPLHRVTGVDSKTVVENEGLTERMLSSQVPAFEETLDCQEGDHKFERLNDCKAKCSYEDCKGDEGKNLYTCVGFGKKGSTC